MAPEILPIHTLNARGNGMLEVVRDYFGLSPDRMLLEIQGMRAQIARTLKSKGINYDDLRAALVPDREKLEIALIFDTMQIEDSWYGYQVFERIIPLLDPRTKNEERRTAFWLAATSEATANKRPCMKPSARRFARCVASTIGTAVNSTSSTSTT